MGLLSDMQRSSLARARAARTQRSEVELRAAARAAPPPLRLRGAAAGFDLIAELKLRSPAAGNLATHTLDPLVRLDAYARGGATLISVLTEPERFDGSLEHLALAADRMRAHGVPVMRKDFLVDPYQVVEARAHGAAGVLLIIRLVDRARLVEMLDCAAELNLFVLLEAFDADDLETLAIDFDRFERLHAELPARWPAVAESGVVEPVDAARVAALGYRYALVGTGLMQRADPESAVTALLAAGRRAVGASA